MGAKVLFPAECPDDVLVAVIKKTQEVLSVKDLSKEGDKVFYFKIFINFRLLKS
jgi:hypothetical protein